MPFQLVRCVNQQSQQHQVYVGYFRYRPLGFHLWVNVDIPFIQGRTEMVYSAFKDWAASEPLSETAEAEKLFLRELYSYMKKMDSPIERIPNLGFKQSKDTRFTRLVAIFKYFRRRSATAVVIPASNCF